MLNFLLERNRKLVKWFFIFLIRVYQVLFSPIVGRNCKFLPTCSQYMLDAIVRFGTVKGIKLGIKRFLRCNPMSKGGYDPVPDKL